MGERPQRKQGKLGKGARTLPEDPRSQGITSPRAIDRRRFCLPNTLVSRATNGVQQPSSDLRIESFDGQDPPGLAQESQAVVERAKAKWGGL